MHVEHRTVAIAALLVLASAAARADEILGEDPLGVLMKLVFIALPIYLSLIVAVWFIEAPVLQRVLRRPYGACIRYAVVANIASLAIGLTWAFYWEGGGLRRELFHVDRVHWGLTAIYLGRSYLASFLAEGAVIWLFTRKVVPPERIAAAAALANAVSYAVVTPFYYLVGLI